MINTCINSTQPCRLRRRVVATLALSSARYAGSLRSYTDPSGQLKQATHRGSDACPLKNGEERGETLLSLLLLRLR
jgi:hypothetical protein